MEPAIIDDVPEQDTIRMGSEYATARVYLARAPRPLSAKAVGRHRGVETQHGSNDTDFGIPDQRAE